MASNFRRIAEQNIFPGESGGDYNALFGYSNREGGRYGGQKLTDMTLNQALDFSKPSGDYGQWVKGQVGRVATPMGAYQVVGTTLRDAQKGLGLTGEERMTEGLQDRIGEWIYQNQGSGAWEGWRGAPSGGGQSIANDTITALGKQPIISAASTPTGGILSNEGNQMAQQPQGLLGSMGIQRRDPNAQGETSQPFYNRQSFGDTMARIAPALGRMGVMGLEGPAQAALDDRNKRQGDERAKQAQAARTNQTREWIASQPNGEQFAAMFDAVGGAATLKAMQDANAPSEQFRQATGADLGMTGKDAGRIFNVGPDGKITSIGGAAPTTNITTNVGPDETAFNKETGKIIAQEADSVAQQGAAAQRSMGQLNALEQALLNSPSGAGGAIANMAANIGIKTEGVENLELANAIISQLVPAQRPPGSGTMSDADLALFKASLPRLINTREGNQLIIDTMRNIAQYDVKRGEIARTMQLGQVTPGVAFTRYNELGNPLSAFQNGRNETPRTGGAASDRLKFDAEGNRL
jgi:hypothetical protein